MRRAIVTTCQPLCKAIDKVLGVNLDDLQSNISTQDRQWGRYIYAKYSNETRWGIAKSLHKVFTTATYYKNAFDKYYENDEEFREYADKVKELYDLSEHQSIR